MEEIRNNLAQLIYEETAKEVAAVIEEYEIEIRKPRKWNDKPSKEYWYEKADAILALLKGLGYVVVKGKKLDSAEVHEHNLEIAFNEAIWEKGDELTDEEIREAFNRALAAFLS